MADSPIAITFSIDSPVAVLNLCLFVRAVLRIRAYMYTECSEASLMPDRLIDLDNAGLVL